MLCGMGFSKDKAKKALLNCDGNVERAVDWLFNHPDDDAPAESILQVSNSSGMWYQNNRMCERSTLYVIDLPFVQNTS